MTTLETAPTATDAAAPPAIVEQLMAGWVGGMTQLMVDLGTRAGLWAALAGAGPLTSAQLADRAGCDERYVREWLAAVACAGLVRHEHGAGTFELPDEHAPFLTGDSPFNLAPIAAAITHLAPFVGRVAEAVRHGGGVPYDEYRPAFTQVMDAMGRTRYDACLVSDYVPCAPGLADRLAAGTRVADVGCGTGHTTNLLARAFPASSFIGYDLADDALATGRAEAAAWGLGNVTFERLDVRHLPAEPAFGLVTAFDCIHDQVDPAGVLARIATALEPGGTFLMVEPRGTSHVHTDAESPMSAGMYAVSVLHCMTVSLAHGGAGLGTMWGDEVARRMLAEAGFAEVEAHDLPVDLANLVYVSTR